MSLPRHFVHTTIKIENILNLEEITINISKEITRNSIANFQRELGCAFREAKVHARTFTNTKGTSTIKCEIWSERLRRKSL